MWIIFKDNLLDVDKITRVWIGLDGEHPYIIAQRYVTVEYINGEGKTIYISKKHINYEEAKKTLGYFHELLNKRRG